MNYIFSGNALKVMHEDRIREIQAANERFGGKLPQRESKPRNLLRRLLRVQ